ncbi:MAG: MBOAT family protein [Euryarchaeota archaeon TMED85]|nr:MAG: MBOAT family protein [Euryarchaeota archaeon]RPG75292.1 MAG: MBOAT family protein [Euryarchaeota archaeon TMED85]
MNFTSIGYYSWFLPLTVFLVLVVSKNKKSSQMGIILLFSYLFFWLASGWHVILLGISTCTDWFIAKKISNTKNKKYRKWLLISTLTLNLGLLATFKYLDMIIDSYGLIQLQFSNLPTIPRANLLLPVGISFYTFQTMSYSIDIYRDKYKPYNSFIDFAAYAAFFPQLVAGPIVRADHFLEQIKKPLTFKERNFRLAVTFILYGVVKKVVFADNVAMHVDAIFTEGVDLTNTILVWWGTLCFGIQIYCDFSAYSDIAIGSALLLGIRLPENFKTPYAARSPQDFWRRWHISLSTWLRDYLYISLGGSRHGQRRLYFALMTTMALGGLWHGASWNFVIWGVVHGLILILHRGIIKINFISQLFESKTWRKPAIIFGWFTTQILIFFTWLIFRVENTELLIKSIRGFLFIDQKFEITTALEALPSVKYLTFALVIVFIISHGISGKINRLRNKLSNGSPLIWGIFFAICLTAIIYLRPSESSEFIYFRF